MEWLNRLLRRKPLEPTHIVVVEPSPFRRAETYVLGPFPFGKAKRVARRECNKHPFSEVFVTPKTSTINLGNTVLWPKEEA